ncbi:hypothetical protein [Niveispirillum fermenti]|uniref:hypothetical protein n=1 Tax=Niveispirillum fermenti TaxID=1233113 RepID=UPI003A83B77C
MIRHFFLRGALAGQWSSTNLDSSEQFPLGGPAGVPADPVSEGSGDSRLPANLELHRPVTEGMARGLDLFGVIDAGYVLDGGLALRLNPDGSTSDPRVWFTATAPF